MSMTDAINIVRMYLFGTSQPSTDDFNKHITREGASPSPSPAYQFSAAAYMTTGAGRYALPSLAPVVKAFFEATSLPDNPAGEPYKYAELLPRLGLTSSTTANVISVSQYGTDILSQDYPERAFIFGSTVFHLDTTKILFHVESGKRWIENLQVIPDKDNWDFTAGSQSAQYINLALGPSLDPYGIGKKVDLVYTGDAPIVTNFTEAMYAESKSKESVIGKNEADKLAGIALLLAGRGEAYLNELTHDPFLSYRHNGKNVIYGSNGADLFTSDSWVPSWGNAVASTGDIYVGANESDVIIGGEFGDMLLGGDGHDDLAGEQGNDTLIGAEGNDILEGGKDNDQLYGDAGSDTYVFNGDFGNDVIVDSDGSGQIEVDGQVLSAQNAKKVSANTYKDKATGWIFFKGDVLTDGTATLVISKEGARNSSITVRNWKSGQMGITLSDTQEAAPTGLSVFKGDQRPLIYGVELTQSGAPNNTYAWERITRDPASGTLLGSAKVEADFADDIYGTDEGDDIQGLGGNDALNGGLGNDKIDGGTGNDLIGGGAGSDTIQGGDGDDHILSGYSIFIRGRKSPTDTWTVPADAQSVIVSAPTWGVYRTADGATIYRTDGSTLDNQPDYIDGGTGNDKILASGGGDYVYGGDGNDTIDGLGGADWLYGGTGNDSISGDGRVKPGILNATAATLHGNDLLDGGAGRDTLAGQGGKDLLFGGYDDDTLLGDSDERDFPTGAHDDDTLYGGWGADFIVGGGKNDLAYGDEGDDILWGDGRGAQAIDASVHGDDTLAGGLGNDTVIGGGGNDLLMGDADNDLLWGDDSSEEVSVSSHGKDTLLGGAGRDQLVGGGDADVLMGGDDGDSLWGDNNSFCAVDSSAHGNDFLDGGDGYDQLKGGGKNDTLIGGKGDDSMWGDDVGQNVALSAHGQDYLSGGDGQDALYGGGESDELHGGSGNDSIYGDAIESEVPSSAHGNDTLNGDEGSDALIGGGKDDILFGGDDNDSLWGDDITVNLSLAAHGNDELYGGAGNDQLIGGGKDDQLYGGTGSDFLSGDDHVVNVAGSAHGADFLDGGADNDYLYGDGGNDTLMGGSGNDFLAGEHQLSAAIAAQSSSLLGDDLLMGEEGNDVLLGGEGNDTLDGGTENDTLIGGAGADTYLFDIGSGQDTIYNEDSDAVGTNKDAIVLGTGITPEGVTLTRADNDLIIGLNDSEDRLYVQGYFQADGTSTSSVEKIQFKDGTTWDVAFVKAKVLTPRSGNNTLYGYDTPDAISGLSGADNLFGNAGDDTLEGGAGNDTLNGGAGSDTYQFGRGDGQDTIASSSTSSVGDIDTLLMKSGITPAEVTLNTAGTALIIKIRESTDQITVEDFLYQNNPNNSKSPLQQIKFTNAPTWSLNTILSNLYGGSDLADRLDGTLSGEVINGQGGSDTLNGNAGNDTLNGGADSDTLDGGVGSDTLRGGTGADTYLFGMGSGQDLINNEDSDALGVNRDTIQLGAGLTPTNVTLTRSSDDLIIRINGSDDQLTVQSYFQADGTSSFMVENLRFDGDTVWNYATVKANVGLIVNGTDANESITGGRGNDALYGQAGSDTLDGGAGNDALDGGPGNDSLRGGAGDDTYRFGKGDGQDIIASNAEPTLQNDTLSFKPSVALSDVRLSKSGTSLLVKIANSTDQVTIEDFFYQDTPTNLKNAVKQLEFTNGIKWSLANIETQLAANFIQGDAQRNKMPGTNKDDVIYGGAGDDILGNDTLTATNGQGNDTFYGQEGRDDIFGGRGNDYLDGGPGDDYLVGRSGNDTIDGGVGNDQLSGDSGNNTYVFGKGDGSDTLTGSFSSYSSDDTGPTVNTLMFKPGVASSEVLLSTSGSSLIIRIASTSDQFTVERFSPFVSASYRSENSLQQIKFASDITWDIATILSKLPPSTNGDDVLYGSKQADVLNGLAGADSLYGFDGNDTLEGGSGIDLLVGGAGNDVYYVDNVNDRVIETTPAEYDRIVASVNYVLPDFVEDMDLAAGAANALKATGNALDNILGGNEFNNVLSGGTGDDHLVGDAGADTMIGGAGDDHFYVDNIGDAVQEDAANGYDTVHMFFLQADSYTLSNNVEAIEVIDMAPVAAGYVTLRGNALDNSLTAGDAVGMALYGEAGDDGLYGGSGNDTLYGGTDSDVLWGGLGQDSMLGGAGDDQYYVSDTGDRITELADEGTDTVTLFGLKAISYTMAAQVENLDIFEVAPSSGNTFTVFGNAQDNVIDGSGSALRVQLSGGAGNDRLFGTNLNDLLVGGGGNDTMYGGLGNDIYSFARSNGQDVIDDADASIGNLDQLTFGTGVANDQLWFSQSGQDLVVSIIGSTDQVTIRQWGAGTSHHVERITAGGKSLADTQVANLVQVMSAMTPPPLGQTTLSDAQRAQLVPVLAANWA